MVLSPSNTSCFPRDDPIAYPFSYRYSNGSRVQSGHRLNGVCVYVGSGRPLRAAGECCVLLYGVLCVAVAVYIVVHWRVPVPVAVTVPCGSGSNPSVVLCTYMGRTTLT